MVDGVHRALAMPGMTGQTGAAQLPTSSTVPQPTVESTFRSMLDYQMQAADLEKERLSGDAGWNSTFGAEGVPRPTADTANESEKTHKAATELESLLVYTMLKQMWDSVDEDSLLGQSMGGKFYREMWLEEVSRKISQTSSLGIAKVIEQELQANIDRTVTAEELAREDQAGKAAGIALSPQEASLGFALDPQESQGYPLDLQ